MKGPPETDPLALIEKDLNMLFVLSLFIILFVFLGFMKIRWVEASFEEEATRPSDVEEEIVRVAFRPGPQGPVMDVDGEVVPIEDVDSEMVGRIADRAAERKVEIELDANIETKDWFPVTYGITKRARAVEFATR
jgi:hypothetical protein